MQINLVMFRSGSPPRTFALSKESTVLGRREDCDLRIPIADVSRKHCRIVISGSTATVEDMGSSNGTFVNGQKIHGSMELEPGDSLQIGPIVFVIQIEGDPEIEQMRPTILKHEAIEPIDPEIKIEDE